MNIENNINFNLLSRSNFSKSTVQISIGSYKETLNCKIKAKGFFTKILNYKLNAKIYSGKYTLLNPNNTNPEIPKIYIKTVVKQGMEMLQEINKQKSEALVGKNQLPSTILACSQWIKKYGFKNESTYVKIREKTSDHSTLALTKKNSKWQICQIASGGSSMVVNPVGEDKVEKIYKKSRKDYKNFQSKVKTILDKVNPDRKAIGLPNYPTFTWNKKEITVYESNGTAIKSKGYLYTETAYISDCLHQNYKKEEVPSMCCCLVQGSKKLIENEIFHVDVKPENVGYSGKGRAEHFDFEGSINLDDNNWSYDKAAITPKFFCLQDLLVWNQQKKTRNRIASKDLFTKIHVFQLGIVFFHLAGITILHEIQWIDGSAFRCSNLSQKNLLKQLNESKVPFNEEQKKMMLDMISVDRNKRPSLEEIEKVFPLDQIWPE